jgi:acetyl esterase/lipase
MAEGQCRAIWGRPGTVGATGGSAGTHLSALLAVTGKTDELEGHGPHQDQTSRIQAAPPVAGSYDLSAIRYPAAARQQTKRHSPDE